MTLDEADEMLAAEKKCGVTAQVGVKRRHAPAFNEAVKRISAIRSEIILARVHDVIGQNALVIDSTTPVVRGKDIADVLNVAAGPWRMPLASPRGRKPAPTHCCFG